jgi:hypothetical protein
VGVQSVEKQQLIALDNRHDIAEILTKNVECMLCEQYEDCSAKGISPWCEGCIMADKMEKYMTCPKVIQPGVNETPLAEYLEDKRDAGYGKREEQDDADYI